MPQLPQGVDDAIKKFSAIMAAYQKGVEGSRTQPMMKSQQIGQSQQFAPPPNVMPAAPATPATMTSGGGGAAPQAQQLNLRYDTSGAGARMPQPTPQPGPTPYTPSPYGNQMMEKLSPNAAGVYTGIQGIAQVVNQWRQQKEQKKQAEAANIATNLADAVNRKDVAKTYEIMTDPKAMKIIDKVYEGWLTQAQDAQKQPDTETQAFNQTLQKYFQGQGPQPQMPAQIGGRMVPQAGPAQLLEAAQTNARLQAQQQQPARGLDTQMSPDQQLNAQLVKSGLIVAPADAAAMDTQSKTSMYNTYMRYITEIAKQNETTKRVMQVSTDKNYTLIKIGAAHDEAKIRSSKIIADSKDYATDKKAGKDPTTAMLKWQLDNFTKLRENASTNYQKATANSDKNAAAIFKDSMDKYDAQIKAVNSQIEGQTKDAYIEKVWNWAAAGGEGEAPDPDDEPKD